MTDRKRKTQQGSGAPAKRQKTLSKVLLLGCGMCAPPLVVYLDKHDIAVTVAARTLSKATAVIKELKHASSVELDVEGEGGWAKLDALTQQADIVVSLLPYTLHVQCAKIALKHSKHFCTASYISDAMEELAEEAKAKGLFLLNECGVDPGLDHMSAQKVIDEVHAKGGKILSFTSICGGLPAPKHNNNPMGYKLSWSPRGVLMAGRNDALFLENGKRIQAPGKTLYEPTIYKLEKAEGIEYEWYPNRDSIKYVDIYRIPESKTVIRGTFRNRGWCEVLKFLSHNGFTSMDKADFSGLTMQGFTARILGGEGDARALAQEKGANAAVLKQLEWMGLFLTSAVPAKDTALDVMTQLWEERMMYAKGEQDMILMRHTFEVEWRRANRETITSTLIDYGQQDKGGRSSMSRTVALPLAIAIRGLVEGDIKERGLLRPTTPAVYNYILDMLAKEEDIRFTEERRPTHIWLRHEVKPGEERVAITPTHCQELIKQGCQISVERSPTRCFPDADYAKVGCELVPTESWKTAVGYSPIVVGLKELPDDGERRQRHIYFAHCYKEQADWKQTLTPFIKDGGLIWDLEYLTDAQGRRVAAFGRAAGQVGMALGVLRWAKQQLGEELGALKSWGGVSAMVAAVKTELDRAQAKAKRLPTALVLGALGRCGGGAAEVAASLGLTTITKWDMEETKKGPPFPELTQHDILLNAILLRGPVKGGAWLDLPQAKADSKRKLSVVVDVSCDLSNPHNPFPLDKKGNTLSQPCTQLLPGSGALPPLDFIGIDHLPSLVPLDSSNDFSSALLPHLKALCGKGGVDNSVWKRAEDIFHSWAKKLPA